MELVKSELETYLLAPQYLFFLTSLSEDVLRTRHDILLRNHRYHFYHKRLTLELSVCRLCRVSLWIGYIVMDAKGYAENYVSFHDTHEAPTTPGHQHLTLYFCDRCQEACGCEVEPHLPMCIPKELRNLIVDYATVLDRVQQRACYGCQTVHCTMHMYNCSQALCDDCVELIHWGKRAKMLLSGVPMSWEAFCEALNN